MRLFLLIYVVYVWCIYLLGGSLLEVLPWGKYSLNIAFLWWGLFILCQECWRLSSLTVFLLGT